MGKLVELSGINAVGCGSPEAQMEPKPVAFISCGQYTDNEKALGAQVKQVVEGHVAAAAADVEVYFAEDQADLEGLTENIFARLDRAVAFVCIMHRRGELETPAGEEIVRASVWIEQEIGIMAYLSRTLQRQVWLAAYHQDGLSREGVRNFIQWNSFSFQSEADVVSDLEKRILKWDVKSTIEAYKSRIAAAQEARDSKAAVQAEGEKREADRLANELRSLLREREALDERMSIVESALRDRKKRDLMEALHDGQPPFYSLEQAIRSGGIGPMGSTSSKHHHLKQQISELLTSGDEVRRHEIQSARRLLADAVRNPAVGEHRLRALNQLEALLAKANKAWNAVQ